MNAADYPPIDLDPVRPGEWVQYEIQRRVAETERVRREQLASLTWQQRVWLAIRGGR